MIQFLFMTTLLFICALAEDSKNGGLISPCRSDDVPCLHNGCTTYVSQVAGGAPPPLNVEKLDPFEVPSIDIPACCEDPPTGIIHMTNITATGLGNPNLTDFKLDNTKKNTLTKIVIDLKITANMVYEKSDKSKTISGTTELKAKCLMTTEYDYEKKFDENGIERFVILPEKSTCEVLEEPEYKNSDEVEKAIISDSDLQKVRTENGPKLVEKRKKFACKVLSAGFPKLIQAFRQLTYFVPMQDYFANPNDV